MDLFNDKRILITGGTGSFGTAFTKRLLDDGTFREVIIYSRDEFKQYNLKQALTRRYGPEATRKVTFVIGDVRDRQRMRQAFSGVDYVVHSAAMKHVPICENQPFEAVKTNILGAENVIETAMECGVKKVVALSTDKAVHPINLYGGTKLVSDKLFIAANGYLNAKNTIFSIVRYGNVAGSRGSIIPLFQKLIQSGETSLPITDTRMTRFWITLDQGIDLVMKALQEAKGGETYISKIPSFHVTDLAKAIGGEDIALREIGIREGEKLHEVMITADDSSRTYEYDQHYIIYPQLAWWDPKSGLFPGGVKIKPGFEYNSGANSQWLTVEDLRNRLKRLGTSIS